MTEPIEDEQQESEQVEHDSKRYVVKTPWYVDSLTGEGHPEVNPHGVEMSSEERQEALATAKQAGHKLKSKEV